MLEIRFLTYFLTVFSAGEVPWFGVVGGLWFVVQSDIVFSVDMYCVRFLTCTVRNVEDMKLFEDMKWVCR